jgi:hypothetical protein
VTSPRCILRSGASSSNGPTIEKLARVADALGCVWIDIALEVFRADEPKPFPDLEETRRWVLVSASKSPCLRQSVRIVIRVELLPRE